MKTFSALALLAALCSASGEAMAPHDAELHAKQCAAGVVTDCVVDSSWSAPPHYGYGACSMSCGQGISTRARTIVHPACNSGKPCPALVQTEDCMEHVCTCSHVSCDYTDHTCMEYRYNSVAQLYHSADPLYHSVDSWVHTAHGRAVDDYADGNGGSYDRRNRPGSFSTAAGASAQANHDGSHGSADGDVATLDYHNETSLCGIHESVRV